MRKRTQARELAIQALYQIDVQGRDILEDAVSFCRSRASDDEVAQFAAELVSGCQASITEIDKEIASIVENWELPRMAVVDRCILRMAVYELLFRDDIPPKVSVNEAIDLAKKYSTENSGTFVNGILDKVYEGCDGGKSKAGKAGKEDKAETEAPSDAVADYGEADLHVHTICSDGTFTPEEVVVEAARLGIKTIAITDHDTVDAVRPAQAEGAKMGVYVIPGVEVSGYVPPFEIHIIGLFIDIDNKNLIEKFRQIHEERVSRLSEIVERLKTVNVQLDVEEILHLAGGSPPGRMHIAEVLIKHGYCNNFPEVFNRYIGDNCPAYVPKTTLTPRQAIELIHDAGGVSVYAHPGVSGRDDIIRMLVESGLQAIEAYYPSHSPETVARYLEIAKKYDLAVSGGSDFHGQRKPGIPLGKVKVPNEAVHALSQRRKQMSDMVTAI
ncbi:MAG: transcription antitermination factor NusB [Planctomycetota bacterium]|jgi:transcription antitermination factor NusB